MKKDIMNSDEDLSSSSSSSSSSPQQTRFLARGFQHSLEDNLSTKSNRKIAKFRSFAKKKDLSQIYARPLTFTTWADRKLGISISISTSISISFSNWVLQVDYIFLGFYNFLGAN